MATNYFRRIKQSKGLKNLEASLKELAEKKN